MWNQPAQASTTCHHRNNFHSQRSWPWPYNVPNRLRFFNSKTIPILMHSDSMDFVYIYIKSYMVLWLTQEIYAYFSAQKIIEFSEFQCPVEGMMALISRHPEWDAVPLAGIWKGFSFPFIQWKYSLRMSCDSYTCGERITREDLETSTSYASQKLIRCNRGPDNSLTKHQSKYKDRCVLISGKEAHPWQQSSRWVHVYEPGNMAQTGKAPAAKPDHVS